MPTPASIQVPHKACLGATRGDGTPLNAVSGVYGETLTYPYGIPQPIPAHNRFRDCQVGGPGYGSARIQEVPSIRTLATPRPATTPSSPSSNGTDQLYQVHSGEPRFNRLEAYDVTTTLAAGITFTSKLPRGVQQLGQHLHEPRDHLLSKLPRRKRRLPLKPCAAFGPLSLPPLLSPSPFARPGPRTPLFRWSVIFQRRPPCERD